MSLDAEVVNDLRNISAAVDGVTKANDRAQNSARKVGRELSQGIRRTRQEVDRSNRSWRQNSTAVNRANQTTQQATVKQRALKGAMGQVNQARGQLQAGMAQLAPALLIPAAVSAAWQKFKEDIQAVRQEMEQTIVNAQDIASTGGFPAFGDRLGDMARVLSTSGRFTAEQLQQAAGSFKGIAKDASFSDTVTLMRRMQDLSAAGFADPNQASRATGALVSGGLDVNTSANLAGFIIQNAGEDAPQLIDLLREGITRFGSDQAPDIAAQILAAADKKQISRISQVIEQTPRQIDGEPLSPRAQFDIARLRMGNELGLSFQQRANDLRPGARSASQNFIRQTGAEVMANNPQFAAEFEIQRQENMADQLRFEQGTDTARRQKLREIRMRSARQEGGVTGTAANITGALEGIPGIGSVIEMGQEARDRSGRGVGALELEEANIQINRRIMQATERMANDRNKRDGL